MKILLCPDKFKGSLSANEVCTYLEQGMKEVYPNAEITHCPLADGGEGSLSAMAHVVPFEFKELKTVDPLGRQITVQVGILEKKVFIETSASNGLHHLKAEKRNPMHTSTAGIGKVISQLLNEGFREFYLFLGGSSTNDGGVGMASELGFTFWDKSGKLIPKPTGKDLIIIEKIVPPKDTTNLAASRFVALTDVQHPMHGQGGAAFCFARQKGASEEDIIFLNEGLVNLDKCFQKDLNQHVADKVGAGAAGALGAGCMAFLNASVFSGLEFIKSILELEAKIADADVVITGEGRIDSESLKGKVVSGISEYCIKYEKPLILVCGEYTLNEDELKTLCHHKIFTISEPGITKEQAIREARERLVAIGRRIW